MINVENLSKSYGHIKAVKSISFDIDDGEIVGFLGPNGAGKSTLIKAILDIVPRASGNILLYGKPFKKQRKLVAYVPQRESVDWDFPIDALGVVTMGCYSKIGWCKPVGKREKQAAMDALDRVGMADYAHRQISQLSGGQQQRVAIARAIAAKPNAISLQ